MCIPDPWLAFSFATIIAAALEIQAPEFPAPLAISYRVGEPAAEGGRMLAIWNRRLQAQQALPNLTLPLTDLQSVTLDLEATYQQAASDAYLD